MQELDRLSAAEIAGLMLAVTVLAMLAVYHVGFREQPTRVSATRAMATMPTALPPTVERPAPPVPIFTVYIVESPEQASDLQRSLIHFASPGPAPAPGSLIIDGSMPGAEDMIAVIARDQNIIATDGRPRLQLIDLRSR